MSEFKIKTLEIAGFASAVQALRLPFGKECRSDVTVRYKYDDTPKSDEQYCESVSIVDFDPKDLRLMSTLVKRGDEHTKTCQSIISIGRRTSITMPMTAVI